MNGVITAVAVIVQLEFEKLKKFLIVQGYWIVHRALIMEYVSFNMAVLTKISAPSNS